MLPAHPYTINFNYARFNLHPVDVAQETARPETELSRHLAVSPRFFCCEYSGL
jgi:hypothetical protein